MIKWINVDRTLERNKRYLVLGNHNKYGKYLISMWLEKQEEISEVLKKNRHIALSVGHSRYVLFLTKFQLIKFAGNMLL